MKILKDNYGLKRVKQMERGERVRGIHTFFEVPLKLFQVLGILIMVLLWGFFSDN